MRIQFIITRADSIGGAHIHVRDIAGRLLHDGHEVQVIAGGYGPFLTLLERSGIPACVCEPLQRAIHPAHDARALATLRREIAAFRPDLVSTHSSKAGILGRLACAAGGPPCLFTAHGWAFTPGVGDPARSVYRWLERGLAPLATRIICVSEHDRRIAVEAGIAPHRLVTIHNGMPDVPLGERARPAAGDPVRMVMVARFAPQKDHATLLRAMAAIDGVHLDLVGEGPTLAETRALAQQLGIGERVHFLGHRDDVASVLARAQLFTLISNWEGFPRSTLEAMRAGLPSVVTDVGGAAEALVDAETGYVIAPRNVVATRERLRSLIDDTALRGRMGIAARRRYEEHFTFDQLYKCTLDLYQRVAPLNGALGAGGRHQATGGQH